MLKCGSQVCIIKHSFEAMQVVCIVLTRTDDCNRSIAMDTQSSQPQGLLNPVLLVDYASVNLHYGVTQWG